MFDRLFVLVSLAAVALAACVAPGAPGVPAVATATPPAGAPATAPPAATPSGVPPVEPLPSAAPGTPPAATPPGPAGQPARPQQQLEAVLDYAAHQLSVRQVLTYPNTLEVPLAELVLAVEADARPGVLALETFLVDGAPLAPERDGARWRLPLARPLASGQSLRLESAYTLALPPLPPGAADAAGGLGWTARQTNLGGWYPVVAPWRDGSWLVHPAGGSGEHDVLAAADYIVTFTVVGPPEVALAASAAGQPVELAGARRWQFAAAELRSFALSAGHEYRVSERAAGTTTVRAYTFPEHTRAGAAALEAAARALTVYGRLYGDYPYPQLALVEADFADGLEFAGLFFLGREYYAGYDGTPQNWLTAIAVHETAHQWWYGLVGNDQALEPWLDEALATYSELLYYESVHPKLVSWWWDFRVRRFQPVGPVDATIYELPAFRPYVDAVYLRGALFLHELRGAAGDAAFFAALQRYAAAHRAGLASGTDFWDAFGNVPDAARLRAVYFRR
jgi:hypothetical protein